MIWIDIAMIVFSVTAANHLGLIDAIEKFIGFKIPIINCCKCASFWLTLIFCIFKGVGFDGFTIVAISFLSSISAIWLELGLGYIDTLYDKAYERIYGKAANADKDNTKTADIDSSKNEMS